MKSELQVFLYGKLMGHLISLQGGRNLFQFDETYLSEKKPVTLSQSFLDIHANLISSTKPRQIKLPPFFSNLLPEGLMRRYLATHANINPKHEFELLRFLGLDLPGAVVVSPAENYASVKALTSSATKEEGALHFSLAGVQLKFSALINHNKITIPAGGIGGHWIVKLPSQTFPYVPENEFAMLQLAKEVGIPVPESRLVSINEIEGLPELGVLNGKNALIVKRFDREKEKRIHMEDFAQVFNVYPHDKYQKVSYNNIAFMLFTLIGEDGLLDFIQRLVFSILIGNGDMHLKNWSLLYPNHYDAVLSPAYDFVSTIPYLPNDSLALSLVGKKKMTEIMLKDFIRLSEKTALPKNAVLNRVELIAPKIRELWQQQKKHMDLPKDIVDRVSAHMDLIQL